MQTIQKAIVKVGAEKSGVTRGKPWRKHAYKFERTDGWFVKFVDVDNPPPLLPEGTIVGELYFESGKFGNDIKEMVNISEPPKASPKAIADVFEGSYAESQTPINTKQHPFWMLWAYVKDLQLARIERICPFPENKQQAFLTLTQLAEDVNAVTLGVYRKITTEFAGDPGDEAGDPATWTKGDPDKDPKQGDEPPPMTDDDIPF